MYILIRNYPDMDAYFATWYTYRGDNRIPQRAGNIHTFHAALAPLYEEVKSDGRDTSTWTNPSWSAVDTPKFIAEVKMFEYIVMNIELFFHPLFSEFAKSTINYVNNKQATLDQYLLEDDTRARYLQITDILTAFASQEWSENESK